MNEEIDAMYLQHCPHCAGVHVEPVQLPEPQTARRLACGNCHFTAEEEQFREYQKARIRESELLAHCREQYETLVLFDRVVDVEPLPAEWCEVIDTYHRKCVAAREEAFFSSFDSAMSVQNRV
jgi:hypothetical protein